MSGQLLLALAAVATGASLLVALARGGPILAAARGPVRRAAMLPDRALMTLAVIFLGGAVLYLSLLLATGAYATRYVWQHAASYQPLTQRLSALLAGQEGTILLWTFITAVLALATLEGLRRAGRADAPGARLVYLVMVTLTAALMALTLRSDPFQSVADAFPAAAGGGAPVEGRGLNPVLQNPWMPVHTAFTFLAYGLVALGFAIGTSQLLRTARGDGDALERGRAALLRVARWSWLLLSLALLSGLVWAYEEMTFGWYWSWDPVEAATLAIWLVLTACLHAPGPAVSRSTRALAAPFLAALAWVVVVFASFVTRSGLHPSVHAFAGGATGTLLGWFLVALVALLAGVTAVAAVRLARSEAPRGPSAGVPSARVPGPSVPSPSVPSARVPLWSATLLPLALAGLIVWGLSYPMLAGVLLQRTVELEAVAFNVWASLVALAILFAMGFTMRGARQRGDRRLGAAVVLLTVVAAFVAPADGLRLLTPEAREGLAPAYRLWGASSVLALLPPTLYALLAILDRWWSAARAAAWPVRLRETGLAAMHAGFAAAVLAMALSTLLTTSVTVTVVPGADRPSVERGIGVRALDLRRSEIQDARGVVVEQREALAVEVYVAGALVSAGTAQLYTYPERNMGRHARVLLDRGALFDTQVIYHGLAEATAAGLPVTVRRIPLAAAVWVGISLLGLGMGLAMTGRLAERRAGRAPAPAHGVPA